MINKTIYQYVDKVENNVKVPFMLWRNEEIVPCDTCGNIFFMMSSEGASCTQCLNVEVGEDRLTKFNWSDRYSTIRPIYGYDGMYILVSPERQLVRCETCGDYRIRKTEDGLKCICGEEKPLDTENLKRGLPYIDANLTLYNDKIVDNSILFNVKTIENRNYMFSIFGNRLECLACPKDSNREYQEVGVGKHKILKCLNGCTVKEVSNARHIQCEDVRIELNYDTIRDNKDNVDGANYMLVNLFMKKYLNYESVVSDWDLVKNNLIGFANIMIDCIDCSVMDVLIMDNPILDVVYNSY